MNIFRKSCFWAFEPSKSASLQTRSARSSELRTLFKKLRRKHLVKPFLNGFDCRPLHNGKTGKASLQPKERSLRDGLDRE